MRKLLIFLSMSLIATSAFAQDTGAVFGALDLDQDGSISETEAQRNAVVTENFALADSDGNGFLTREEFDAAFG